MPEINHYRCNQCELSLPSGWGGCMYVEDDDGRRIICPHPGERSTVAEALGKDAPRELVEARTGFNSHCVCLDCLGQFKLDIKKDDRRCPHCNSRKVKTVRELVGEPCPKCKEGVIEEIWTGWIS